MFDYDYTDSDYFDQNSFEPDYYDPCDHCCACELEHGCSSCNPEDLPTYP